MTKKLFLTSFISFLFIFMIGVTLVFAQGPGGSAPSAPGGSSGSNLSGGISNPLGGTTSLFALLKKIINDAILPIGGVLAVLAFIYSGFLYVVAQGNETKLATAHRALLYTSIGTAVLLGSWLLANVICTTIELIGGPTCPS